ncbi:MAG TPA: hypothetical protein VII66_03025 [Gemmatimonadaceae bacterium]
MAAQSNMVRLTRALAREVDDLKFSTPSHVYNPLDYAWAAHREYLQRYGTARGRVLLLGMNPGPWGMAQTGVPFGDVVSVREWFGIQTRLGRALPEQHPKYPILGMDCHRNEGSGSRLGAGRARGSARRTTFSRASSSGITARSPRSRSRCSSPGCRGALNDPGLI